MIVEEVCTLHYQLSIIVSYTANWIWNDCHDAVFTGYGRRMEPECGTVPGNSRFRQYCDACSDFIDRSGFCSSRLFHSVENYESFRCGQTISNPFEKALPDEECFFILSIGNASYSTASFCPFIPTLYAIHSVIRVITINPAYMIHMFVSSPA